jgi:multicomponent Na+:H+ antiporter subunit D
MSSHLLLILPVVSPFLGVVLSVLFRAHTRIQRGISVAASTGLLVSSLLLLFAVSDGSVRVTSFGSWPAPFGINFVGDMLSSAMVAVTGVIAFAISVYGLGYGTQGQDERFYHPLYQGLLLGVTGSFLTGDIFNLYVWFEIMLVSSFGLLAAGGTREQLDAGVKYVVLNLVATTFLLMAIALLYGTTGTLNMADLGRVLPDNANPGLVSTIAMLFLITFGAKAAVFPLFFWLPAAYHTASVPVVALFAALLTKVGVYALIRSFTLLFDQDVSFTGPVFAIIAVLTMVTGVLGAAAHFDIRRILSFHIISQIGYMLVALAVATPLALAGGVFYIVHHILVKANLFLIAGIVQVSGGSFHLKNLGGLYKTLPYLGVLFLVPALSLAGLPPLSGFWAKFTIIKASLDAGHILLAVTALVVGVLTLYSMLKIWNEAFWKAAPADLSPILEEWNGNRVKQITLIAPVAGLAAITMAIGLFPEPLIDYSIRTANQLLDKSIYINAVLGVPDDIAEVPE